MSRDSLHPCVHDTSHLVFLGGTTTHALSICARAVQSYDVVHGLSCALHDMLRAEPKQFYSTGAIGMLTIHTSLQAMNDACNLMIARKFLMHTRTSRAHIGCHFIPCFGHHAGQHACEPRVSYPVSDKPMKGCPTSEVHRQMS